MWHQKQKRRLEQIRTAYILVIVCLLWLCFAAWLVGVDVVAIIGELPRYAGMFAKMVADAWR